MTIACFGLFHIFILLAEEEAPLTQLKYNGSMRCDDLTSEKKRKRLDPCPLN